MVNEVLDLKVYNSLEKINIRCKTVDIAML
jgi:hypothetical protein